jgi:hypothetical protein
MPIETGIYHLRPADPTYDDGQIDYDSVNFDPISHKGCKRGSDDDRAWRKARKDDATGRSGNNSTSVDDHRRELTGSVDELIKKRRIVEEEVRRANQKEANKGRSGTGSSRERKRRILGR